MPSFRITQVIFWLGLAIYLGGLVTLGGIVAWPLFSVLGHTSVHVAGMSTHLNQSRQLAGLIFGRILEAFNVVEIVCLALMFLAIFTQMALHLNLLNIWVWLRLTLAVLLLLLSVYDIFIVSPAIHRQHHQWIANVDTHPAIALAHRRIFWKLHRQSEALGTSEIGLLLILLVVSAWGISQPTRRKFLTLTPASHPPSPTNPHA